MTENDSAFDIIIEPEKSTSDFIRELVKFRELFLFMALRDVLVRYKQTAIGVAWSVIRPLMSMIVFTLIFGRVAKLPSGGIPYPVMVFSALGVKYRDFRHIMPFILQAGLFISPVGFSSAIIPQRWRMIYSLNPMAGVIDGFRWCIHGGELYVPGVIISVISSAVIFVIGLKYFRKTEKFFADYI